MLYFVYPELALGYLLFAFLSTLGVLQLVAVRYGLTGLAILGYSKRRALGYALGALLIVGSALWYFASQWAKILTPGPAGSELALLFVIAAACALITALAVATLRKPVRRATLVEGHAEDGQPVTLGRTTGRLYMGASPAQPLPAISLVPGPDSLGQESLAALARHIVSQGMVALLLTPEQDSYTYPEILAMLPAATSWLAKHPEVDTQRIGALGYDLGGDLVIRAASTAKELKAVAAVAPILGESPAGLELLREMPYPMALRWARNQKRANLQNELNAAECAPKIAPRPLLLLYGAGDALVVSTSTGSDDGVPSLVPALETGTHLQSGETMNSITLRVIQDAGHLNLLDRPETVHAIVQWFQEHL